jgi:cell division protein YceG involved in septum cleavage
MITIVIYSGDSSVAVSRRLEAAGLVPSAVRYDRYLCDNDYDKILRVGTYEIPEGADDETIAEIITRL